MLTKIFQFCVTYKTCFLPFGELSKMIFEDFIILFAGAFPVGMGLL